MLTILQEVHVIFNIEIRRDAKIPLKRFRNYFKGFENIAAVREIFGEETNDVLNNLKVEFFSRRGYMGVSNDDGHLLVSANYLKNGDERDIYLDVIHELVHVRQHRSGIELPNDRFRYCDRPTEIEAFTVAVKEARRIGMKDNEIFEYLKTEWMTEDEVKKLAEALNVKCSL
ncbi:MAG: hypothetical protein V1915_00730 [Candidatus Bathyarchaeota archaeon]